MATENSHPHTDCDHDEKTVTTPFGLLPPQNPDHFFDAVMAEMDELECRRSN